MANTKIIKQKIKAIGNIKKITKTMEMVSFAKMKKSANEVTAILPYINEIKNTLHSIGINALEDNSLAKIQKGASESELVIVYASNKGLCGSFNTNVYRKLKKELETNPNIKEAICFGKFAEKIARRLGLTITLSFLEIDKVSKVNQIAKIENLVRAEFINKKYKKVQAIYTNFIKLGIFETQVSTIYPISNLQKMTEVIGDETVVHKKSESKQIYNFEPSINAVINVLIPKMMKVILFSYLLESRASEHSSRSFAMKRASESASDIQTDLKLLYNKVRQDSITQEIAEISAGANAS